MGERSTRILHDKINRILKLSQSGASVKGDVKFGIFQKLILGFLIPVALIVFLGFISYSKASEGLIRNYEQASENTFEMAASYMEHIFYSVDAISQQYTSDNDMNYFTRGLIYTNSQERLYYLTNINNKLLTQSNLEKFIENIHIIAGENIPVLTSDMENINGFYPEIEHLLKDKEAIWIGGHSIIDEKLTLDENSYALSFLRKFPENQACIVIDISKTEVDKFLGELNLGKNSFVGLVMQDKNEILIQSYDQNETQTDNTRSIDFVFSDQEYYKKSVDSEQLFGSEYVDYQGQEHLFMYRKIGDTGVTICGMVPKTSFMQQANDIRSTTVIVVLIACIVAVTIGFFISNGIGRTIKYLIQRLQKISEGDLTAKIDVNRKDEFAILVKNITNMLNNMRRLIQKMSDVSGLVSASAGNVMDVSKAIAISNTNITTAIDDISSGIEGQANDSQQCLVQMDELSHKIKIVNNNLDEIEAFTEDMKRMVFEGIQTMESLTRQSEETNRITKYVVDNITLLEEKTKAIEEIINVINDIADQTNLLSLNASIEAARAGEVGRGFAVVASEIRKLANMSVESSDEIKQVISEIMEQTSQTVGTALEAEHVVDRQNDIVNHTIRAFQNMNYGMEKLINNLLVIGNNVKNMEEARKDTLSAVENISAVSEETLATSCTIERTVDDQSASVKALEKASNELIENARDLDEAINIFQI